MEAAKYCMSDSVLLAMCAEKVEDAILELTENEISLLNSSAFTLAALTMTIFKHRHMHIPIGIVPHQGRQLDLSCKFVFFDFRLLEGTLFEHCKYVVHVHEQRSPTDRSSRHPLRFQQSTRVSY